MSEHEVTGGLFGSYPARRKIKMPEDKHLSEEIEIEEVCPGNEQEARDIQAKYDERKHAYATKIVGELEAFTEKRAEEWGMEDEHILIDILSFVDNIVKARLSANDENHKG